MIREGYCSQCGDCCRSKHIKAVMSQNDNVIDGVQYCDFARKEDGKFICSLIERLKTLDDKIDIGTVIDSKIVTTDIKTELGMTDEQARWCCGEIDYPNPEKDNHTPPHHYVNKTHPNCTFGIVEDDY